MRPPVLPLLILFSLCGAGFSFFLPTLIRRPPLVALDLRGINNELKLSPVPPEVAVGLPSPPVPELLGTEFEVHEAPAAPHNFILQPVRPSGAHPSNPYQKPQGYDTNNHYFINQQGNLVQRPQRPQYGLGQMSSRPPSLNFNESPPQFPHLTDEQLYMLGQPVPQHQTYQTNETYSPEVVEEEALNSIPSAVVLTDPQFNANASLTSQAITVSSQPTVPQPFMLPKPPHAASTQPLKPANQHIVNPIHPNEPSTPPICQKEPTLPPFQPLNPSNQPSMAQNRPAGEYIATVSYGPSIPSSVYTCIPTEQLKPGLGGYVQGPFGYSCKMSKGRPSLAIQILMANNQKPVAQPVVAPEPVSLPIVTPIKFVEAVRKNVK